MGLRAGVTRSLSLCAVVLVLPAVGAAQSIMVEPPQNFAGERVIVTGIGWQSGDQIRFTWSQPIGTNAKTGVSTTLLDSQ